MRGVISLGVLALAAGFSAPAIAMCGGGMQMAQAQTSQPQAQAQGSPAQPPSDMIVGACGMGATAAAGGQAQRRSGMCGCCQNMAMMRGMMGGQGATGQGGQGSMPGMSMPGMQTPSPSDQKPADPPKQP